MEKGITESAQDRLQDAVGAFEPLGPSSPTFRIRSGPNLAPQSFTGGARMLPIYDRHTSPRTIDDRSKVWFDLTTGYRSNWIRQGMDPGGSDQRGQTHACSCPLRVAVSHARAYRDLSAAEPITERAMERDKSKNQVEPTTRQRLCVGGRFNGRITVTPLVCLSSSVRSYPPRSRRWSLHAH